MWNINKKKYLLYRFVMRVKWYSVCKIIDTWFVLNKRYLLKKLLPVTAAIFFFFSWEVISSMRGREIERQASLTGFLHCYPLWISCGLDYEHIPCPTYWGRSWDVNVGPFFPCGSSCISEVSLPGPIATIIVEILIEILYTVLYSVCFTYVIILH